MKLILESLEDYEVLTEEKNGQKNLYIKGIFLQADKKNRNGRIYPFDILNREVSRYSKMVQEGRAVGELGHPDTPSINLDRVSHKIVELYPDGSNFIGKAKILETPHGMIARKLIEGGVKLGVSSRGVGSLKPHNGYQLVQDDYMLCTAADIVADPSAPDAFVSGIMENSEWIFDGKHWREADAVSAQKYITEASKTELEERKLQVFEKFLFNLAKS